MQVFERLESEVRGYCRAFPTVFQTARNAHQVDEGGRSYIDFFAGAGVLNFGHNNPRLKKALIDYLSSDGVVHSLDMYTTAKRTFIQRFDEVILRPRKMHYKMQFTGPTGTNAVEAALKLARKVTGRQGVVAFTDGFHGMTLGALACTGNGLHRAAAGVSLDHVTRLPFDGYLGEGVDTLEALRRQLRDPSSGLTPPAAFIVETIQAEGGVNVARPEWLKAVQGLAREYGSLFIVDDIQVGCGRTGGYFSFDDLDLDPDVVCLAKGIGGFGTPLAMLLVKPEHDVWSPGEHTGTFRGQDLSFVAGAEALEYFRDDAFGDDVRRKGRHTSERLGALVGKHRHLDVQLREKGMIHGLDFGDGDVAKRVSREAFERGLIIANCGPGARVLKVMAPLTIEDDTLDEGIDILDEAMGALG
ncbi:MAG: diaminobutyrate--2-oxoglutarate transaminase [Myxococcota bacterium]